MTSFHGSQYTKSNLKPASHCQIIWWFDGSEGKSEGKSGSGSTQSDDRMRFYRIRWSRKDFDMSDSIGWIASDYSFLSLCEMHYGIDITKIVSDRSGSGNEKSDGIWANINLIRLRSSTPMSSNSLKSGNETPALGTRFLNSVQLPHDPVILYDFIQPGLKIQNSDPRDPYLKDWWPDLCYWYINYPLTSHPLNWPYMCCSARLCVQLQKSKNFMYRSVKNKLKSYCW